MEQSGVEQESSVIRWRKSFMTKIRSFFIRVKKKSSSFVLRNTLEHSEVDGVGQEVLSFFYYGKSVGEDIFRLLRSSRFFHINMSM